ncbi:sensor histidine kinase [Ligilactobacillus equi]|uniref:histidine kinase n=2 Tax=Ligilactobacillus equi TaxID=137357 RepID=V7HXT6_9LACO|nr:HAMP domain-containing sensor histidine kinase [Ligilactobacillus equi]ETA74105.1 signal transduction histidine kinase [Ligilactobacillus equi DPC 6820]KRL82053.1 signal transduction histidine kinase [Ligilactobacillus equi DSM 15833 = JCM 10991]MCQ2557134.1 HAMP domain-containing histidine kinase [Ligilactobacillus sp.]
MIQKFRNKFLVVTVMTLTLVLLTVIGSMVVVTSWNAQKEIETILTVLVDNEGRLTQKATKKELGPKFNPESIFQYRYFSARANKGKRVNAVDIRQINSISPEIVTPEIEKLLRREGNSGMVVYNQVPYAYQIKKAKNGYLIVFLDVSTIRERVRSLVRVGLWSGLVALFLFVLLLSLFSKRAIRPIIEAYDKQKEFITNAGHELKTPLTIISANTELQEMMNGGDEWTESNKMQVSRLTRLIEHFIVMARLTEQENISIEKINFSEIVRKVSQSFKSVMTKEAKEYDYRVESDLQVEGNEAMLLELVNILLDNASKYCDPNGQILVVLRKGRFGKNAVLEVANTYIDGKNVDYSRFFDRFYRQDQSHSNQKKGFGIGLSMAQHYVENMKGKITVSYKNEKIIFTVYLKLK